MNCTSLLHHQSQFLDLRQKTKADQNINAMRPQLLPSTYLYSFIPKNLFFFLTMIFI